MSHAHDAITGPTQQPEDSRPVVLIIDDSHDVHRLLKARLRQEDVEFISATSGEEGLQIAAVRSPALILLDLDMPGIDGFQVLRLLKDRHETRDIAVIVLSGLNTAADKVTAFDLGAVDYVMKPFDISELRVRMRSSLRMHSLISMLAQRAQFDGLTGLWNRQYFDRRVEEDFARSLRSNRPFSVAMIDADNFKSINDTYGHPVGDMVLQGIAKMLNRELRHTDIACRYGGEEFVVVMNETGIEDARATCERLRVACQDTFWPRHPERHVSISIGVCGSDSVIAGTANDFVQMADEALYTAKRSGRNRVVAIHADEVLKARFKVA